MMSSRVGLRCFVHLLYRRVSLLALDLWSFNGCLIHTQKRLLVLNPVISGSLHSFSNSVVLLYRIDRLPCDTVLILRRKLILLFLQPPIPHNFCMTIPCVEFCSDGIFCFVFLCKMASVLFTDHRLNDSHVCDT